MLHIINGDSAAGTAKSSGLPGEIFAWREALVWGPTPGSLPVDEFLQVRARHLSAVYGVPIDDCARESKEQEAVLANAGDHEEVVIWCEHDLFCQVYLIYLLHRFAPRDWDETRLSLVCIGEFEGLPDFRGLGELNENQLASLFPKREEVSPAQLELGAKAWSAYSAPDAAELISLVDSDLSGLPFLKVALKKHLQRFPSTVNGLGRVGNVALELVADGNDKFKTLFPEFVRRESEYGFGDAQLFLELERLALTPNPLLIINSERGNGSHLESQEMIESSFEITAHGQAVLRGTEDFVHSNGIDQWLGGIHLQGNEAAWRWDEDAGAVVSS